MHDHVMFIFFFFQAEDGIRDVAVTGVQTCALPIFTTAGQFDDSEFAVLLYEFKADLNKYLGEWAPAAGATTLADLIAFNERTKEKEMPYFGQEIFVQAQAK